MIFFILGGTVFIDAVLMNVVFGLLNGKSDFSVASAAACLIAGVCFNVYSFSLARKLS